MIPLLLLITVLSLRHIKQKNIEIDEKEKEIYFEEMEKERQQIYQKLYDEHHRREIEIAELFVDDRDGKFKDLQSPPNQIQSKLIDGVANIDHQGDSTDDEFFEMPLPPLPQCSSSPKSEKLSIIDNEEVSPSTARIQETPKVSNVTASFKFPPSPTRKAPSPSIKTSFDSSSLPPVPPRPSSISPPNSPKSEKTDQRDSAQPVIIDLTPKSLLQSDF